jgi:hypothetical protein
MQSQSETKELQSFGLIVGGIFSIIGLWPVIFRSESSRLWAVALGVGLIGLGIVIPRSLKQVYKVWMRIGHALGWINTRILLGVIFYGLITPMGFFLRLLGKDAMRRVLVQEASSYRIVRSPRSQTHMKNQF